MSNPRPIAYAVRSEKQRKHRNGQCFISRSLDRAVTEASYIAARRKQRMYVVIYRNPPPWLRQ